MDAPKLQHIKLSNLLKGQFINLDLKGDSKIEVIRELVKLIAKSKKLKNNYFDLNKLPTTLWLGYSRIRDYKKYIEE